MQFDTSEQLCQYVADRCGGVAILAFSTGKDSIASWLHMRRFFKRIIPYYLYSIPNLSFVNNNLAYFEKYFGTRIIRLPHPSLYRWLNNLTFQAPENCALIEDMEYPEVEYEDINSIIKEDMHLPEDTFTASGVRARDSLNRWTAIKKYGPLNESRRTFFPIFDFDKARLLHTLKSTDVQLPVDYRLFGRTFDGLDYRFLKPIKDNFPEDYARILEFFPLAELEVKRMEYRAAYYGLESL